jgi:hypothetical protein
MRLTTNQLETLLGTVQSRFERNMRRHAEVAWADVLAKLRGLPEKLRALYEMERTGGEPDVIGQDQKTGAFIRYFAA